MVTKYEQNMRLLFLNGEMFLVAPFVTFLVHFIEPSICESSIKDLVLIKPHANVKYFTVPMSDEPIMTWMDIQKGVYPNTSYINASLKVGEPITIFIYMKDASNLYDIMVNNCWAHDEMGFQNSNNKLHLNEDHQSKRKLDKWTKKRAPNVFLYTSFTSFKFPDKDQVHIQCDIQLCYKSCDNSKSP